MIERIPITGLHDDAPPIARVLAFRRATAADRRTGFLGTVKCVFAGGLVLDHVSVRRTAGGRVTLSFPMSRTRSGRARHVARPFDDDARIAIEAAILAQIDIGEATTP